jgi:hypothetical protein
MSERTLVHFIRFISLTFWNWFGADREPEIIGNWLSAFDLWYHSGIFRKKPNLKTKNIIEL